MTGPIYRTGKICYVEIPAKDVAVSADFYQSAFGWRIRQRGDGATAFDDAVGEVSGTWVLDRQPSEPGTLIYIMVANLAASKRAVVAAGGEIVASNDPQAPEMIATFRDPAGNLMGIYQQPGLEETERQS